METFWQGAGLGLIFLGWFGGIALLIWVLTKSD